MAYWFGGSGNWSDAAHWSNNSGNSPASLLGHAPTASEDAIFDANSHNDNYTVTIDATATCKDINIDKPTGVGKKITIAGSAGLTVSGSSTLTGGSAGITMSHTGTTTMNASSGTVNLTFNGSRWPRLTFNGAATFMIMDSCDGITTWTLTTGTVDFTTHTTTITGNSGSCTFNGAFTFYNLTMVGSAAKTRAVILNGSITVTHTLTLNGNSSINRLLVRSGTKGVQSTITITGTTGNDFQNVDFKDVNIITGGADLDLTAITGLSGDCGGNDGITFTTADTMYFYKASGNDNWSTAGNWFLGTGGSGGAGRVPLPQDDVEFNGDSFGAGSMVLTQDMPRAGRNINWAEVDNTPTWTTSTAASIFGSLTLGYDMVLTASTETYTFEGRSDVTLVSVGHEWAKNITHDAAKDCKLIIADNLTTTGALNNANGTLDAATYDVSITVGSFSQALTNDRKTLMGTKTWTLTGTGKIWTGNGYFECGTSTIKITDSSSTEITFAGGSKTYNNVWFDRGASTATNTITGSNTFNDFKDTGTAAHTIAFTAGTTQTVNTFTVNGTAGKLISLRSSSTTHATLASSSGVINCSYLDVDYIIGSPANTWYVGSTSADGGHNTNIYFGTHLTSTITDTMSLTDSEVKTIQPNFTDTVNLTDANFKINSKTIADVVSLIDSHSSAFLIALADAIGLTDSKSLSVTKSFSDTVSLAESLHSWRRRKMLTSYFNTDSEEFVDEDGNLIVTEDGESIVFKTQIPKSVTSYTKVDKQETEWD